MAAAEADCSYHIEPGQMPSRSVSLDGAEHEISRIYPIVAITSNS
jgi:hypothetical protein